MIDKGKAVNDEIPAGPEGRLNRLMERGVVVEKKREDKNILFTMPRSQWMNRKNKQLKAKKGAASGNFKWK